MRKLPAASVAIILAIALYFTLFWGSEALRMLISPTWGLDDVWRAQFVFALGNLLGLTPVGLIKLAAFFAVLKLAIAAICALHIIDRLIGLMRGTAEHDILEAGLILVVAISILSVGPAVWSQNVELARDYTVQLVLAALAATLGMLERRGRGVDDRRLVLLPNGARWFTPWR